MNSAVNVQRIVASSVVKIWLFNVAGCPTHNGFCCNIQHLLKAVLDENKSGHIHHHFFSEGRVLR